MLTHFSRFSKQTGVCLFISVNSASKPEFASSKCLNAFSFQ
jgi:hypothetical protein